jgi:hypothetical protein
MGFTQRAKFIMNQTYVDHEAYGWEGSYAYSSKIKKSSKRNQNPSRYYYYNSIITNLKFQNKKHKISSFKIPHIKIDLLLPMGQTPLHVI